MTSCSHMCSPSCNGSHEPFFNKTMLNFTQQGDNTVSALLLPFLVLPDPHICHQSSISGIIGTASWASHEFERTRDKVTTSMERNVLRHHTELLCLNNRSYRIEHSR
ncbi:uncharacterized protein TNCV_2147671 [Trichonephila clavipes]|uniref:Uncharacterized protein n=1 Tax=Trichonephila clavipes TaxID=2585209 RepID=A0A8X6VND1_TRICX|nr:uncharacterized protein TNCV_2147671 [Trichonephila clavipes]